MMKNQPNLQSIRELGKAKGSWVAWYLQGDVIKIGNSVGTFFISFIMRIMYAKISINIYVGVQSFILHTFLASAFHLTPIWYIRKYFETHFSVAAHLLFLQKHPKFIKYTFTFNLSICNAL